MVFYLEGKAITIFTPMIIKILLLFFWAGIFHLHLGADIESVLAGLRGAKCARHQAPHFYLTKITQIKPKIIVFLSNKI